jgi:two-component system heavy metal sensor histidine kinase CusS
LTLLFALASALVLFLLGLFIGNAVERHFIEMDRDVLSNKMAAARAILRGISGTDAALPIDYLDAALSGDDDLVAAVYDDKLHVLYQSAELEFPPELLANPGGAATDRPIKWTADDGRHWRAIADRLLVGDGAAYTVAIALEISHHEHFMESFRVTLWIFMTTAALAMGLLGWFVVRRGLAPLQTIKRRAGEITARRLHTRLPVEAIPLELADVAGALNDMLSRLEESFQRLLDFSSDLAHELRTPVSNLLTQTQVTLSRARTAEEYREILAINAEEFERLSRIIADMLFLAQAENRQIIPNREQLELADEVSSLLEFYEVLAEEKGIRLSAAGEGRVAGDRLMLRRAVNNLLANALHHTPAGGAVEVSIAPQDSGEVLLTVTNTGPEIPAEHLPRLFDRFYRADPVRQRSTEGSGLGLAITRSILIAHGGDVSVSSSGGLTRFVLRLPPGS